MKAFCYQHFKKILLFSLAFSFINASAQLNADFTSNNKQGCSPLVVQFKDISSGNPINWYWDLGNGAVSTQKNPGAIYVNPGSYTITLHIENASGKDSVIDSNYITVYDNPDVEFSALPLNGCAPLDVIFTDESKPGSGSIAMWIWDFGDGNISNLKNPLHTYTVSDTFDVTLTIINSFGCKKTLQQQSLVKVDGLTAAGFTYSYADVCKPPANVTFANTSQSTTNLTYQWQFGDGKAGTDKDPVHTYTTSGNFKVQLTATNETGCTNTFSEIISVGGVKADFNSTTACVNEPVFFTDTSLPKPLSETWDFGDGGKGSGLQVKHVYNTRGSFQVTLSADFGGCSDTVRKTIKTEDKIKPGFTASGTLITCIYPSTIQFTNTTQGATAYKWLFGDGSSSSVESPSHTYNDPGQYSVALIAYNTNGCPDTIVKNNFIQLGPPDITGFENFPFEGCAPQTLLFKPIINSGSSINSYKWNFGDGGTSTDSVASHTYKNTGIYQVSLVVTTTEGCSDTLILPNAVSLGKVPKSHFIAAPLDVCAETAVQFTDQSKGLITEWLWLFGDGGSSPEQNPSHLYSDTGYNNVTLITGQYGCYDTLIVKKYVHIKPPIAKFNFGASCSAPYTYAFNDNSIAPQSWLWDFGDGSTSAKNNDSHTYSAKGIYYISLTVTNGSCTNTESDSLNVIKESPFFKLPATSCKYDSIGFFAKQYDPNNIKLFQWDFGDGTSSGLGPLKDSVYHQYNTAGNYSPLLIIKDLNNCLDTIRKNFQIQIYGPNAAFSNKSGDCISSLIDFKDESVTDGIHAITKWIWNYGDSSKPDTLISGPFAHTYNQKGAFDVSLKIFDTFGCYDTVANITALEITKPVAAFSAADTLTCSGSAVQFVDSSDGTSLIYTWKFGDGQNANNPAPLHYYSSEGLYDVQLYLQDKYGCIDSAFKTQYIRVANPVAYFSLPDSLFLCPPAKINPVNLALNYSELIWDFGDGNTSSVVSPEHYYTSANNYNLKLIVQGYGNCYDSFTKPLVLKGPVASLSYSPFTGCNPLNVSFSAKAKNTVEFIWDFGDGVTQISTDSNASYVYTKPGKFLPQIIVVDSGGCRVPVVNADTIVVFGVAPKFSVMKHPGFCDSSRYDFIDSSIVLYDNISSYLWKFGDGDSSSLINPFHYYHNQTLYNTSLNIITQKGCIDSFQLPLPVLIDSTPLISATVPDSACLNVPVFLSANALNIPPEDLTWLWNLTEGLKAYSKDTTHSFISAGKHNLSVTATSVAGCSTTVSDLIRIDTLPVVNAGADSFVCRGKPIILNAAGANIYTWLTDATLSCLNCASSAANPLINTTYYLTGTNSFGCSAGDSVNINVEQPANVLITAPDTICVGNTIQLKATGAELYNWQPASLVNNNTDSITLSTPQATTMYYVIGNDNKGCFYDTAFAMVNVFPYPRVQIEDSNITMEAGSEYKINTFGSEDINYWQWNPPVGLSCSNCPQPIVKAITNQAYTVYARNIAGCNVEKHVTITVTCKGANLFIPNTFSPNADGVNDYFYPRGKGFIVKSLRIFSRWGTIVYQNDNFQPNQQAYGWDGKYKGQSLQPDVYVFVAEILCDNGTVISSKGNVTLLR